MSGTGITILGCGWLGLSLGRRLAAEGYIVKGSTTTESRIAELKAAGIEPFLVRVGLTMEGDIAALLESEILVIDFPPERREDVVEHLVEQMSNLIDAMLASSVRKVLFVSSTSVYPATGREMMEEDAFDPDAASSTIGSALLYAEEMLLTESAFATTVVRFCGLIGQGREPAGFLSRMEKIADPDQPVNLIHLDDCIAVIEAIIRKGVWGEIFNACSPQHPSRRAFYEVAAKRNGITLPPMGETADRGSFRTISSRKLEERLGFTFAVPDPLAMGK